MEIKVGQTVYLKAIGNAALKSSESKIEESQIVKIGRKYITVGEGWLTKQFDSTNDYVEKSDYTPNWKLYFSHQAIRDEDESRELEKKIRTAIRDYGKTDLSLDQLRRIYEIIEGEKNNV